MNDASKSGIGCQNLTISVPGRRLIDALELDAAPGEFIAVLGPNGVGKSLALHSLAGVRAPDLGSITLGGEDVAGLTRQQVALSVALLPQYTEDFFPATVFDTVMIGRHPHIGRLSWESDEDFGIARQSLSEVDLADFANRDVLTLSGGERRRLAVAQVLTQSPNVFLLDEPTNHLDPQHQLDVLRIFRNLANDGKTVLASLHDVNLAARFADRCLLLFGDGRWKIGVTGDLLDSSELSDLYHTPMETVPWHHRQLFVAAG
ncbi:MAG: ABC transporter ATP-binding protein [Gammaproteobacteria bacterium]|nr:ABC transporter ATP-binding protein [Gammaproteobacteria bacterium]